MAVTSADDTVLTQLEAADRLLIQQVLKPVANEYRISVPAPGSTEEGRTLLYSGHTRAVASTNDMEWNGRDTPRTSRQPRERRQTMTDEQKKDEVEGQGSRFNG